MSSVTVKIPTPLRPMTAGQSEVKIEGATVGEVLQKMDSQFKGFGDRIMDAVRVGADQRHGPGGANVIHKIRLQSSVTRVRIESEMGLPNGPS